MDTPDLEYTPAAGAIFRLESDDVEVLALENRPASTAAPAVATASQHSNAAVPMVMPFTLRPTPAPRDAILANPGLFGLIESRNPTADLHERHAQHTTTTPLASMPAAKAGVPPSAASTTPMAATAQQLPQPGILYMPDLLTSCRRLCFLATHSVHLDKFELLPRCSVNIITHRLKLLQAHGPCCTQSVLIVCPMYCIPGFLCCCLMSIPRSPCCDPFDLKEEANA